MDIQQFRFSKDNLGYLVYTKNYGIAIDGGAVDEIIEFANKKNVKIIIVTNTHNHADHTPGNGQLVERTGATFLDCTKFSQGQILELENGQGLEVLLTPGHTTDSVCFKGEGFIVTGDTLFNATVGNCFSGDLKAFYDSLLQLMALPHDTRVYAGHDYVAESLTYARIIEPDNPELETYKEKYDENHVVSCLSDELKVNPYIRFNAPSMISRLEEKDLPRESGYDRFSSIMEIY